MHNESTVSNLLTDLLDTSRLLIDRLKMDKDYFETSNLILIEENNTIKMAINDKLAVIINTLINHTTLSLYEGDFFQRVQLHANTLFLNEKKECLRQCATLQNELPTLAKTMRVNRIVIHANLAQTKDLFCAILNKDNTNEPALYQSSGLVENQIA